MKFNHVNLCLLSAPAIVSAAPAPMTPAEPAPMTPAERLIAMSAEYYKQALACDRVAEQLLDQLITADDGAAQLATSLELNRVLLKGAAYRDKALECLGAVFDAMREERKS